MATEILAIREARQIFEGLGGAAGDFLDKPFPLAPLDPDSILPDVGWWRRREAAVFAYPILTYMIERDKDGPFSIAQIEIGVFENGLDQGRDPLEVSETIFSWVERFDAEGILGFPEGKLNGIVDQTRLFFRDRALVFQWIATVAKYAGAEQHEIDYYLRQAQASERRELGE